LGKETVQNVLALRFANTLFEHLWNREHVESVELTAAETIGVGRRAQYYERSGALRDMIQNHLTQVMTLIGMEAPESLDERSLRHSRLEFLQQVRPVTLGPVVFGQYDAGVIDGGGVAAYVEEEGVKPESRTPTYAAVRLEVDNDRWAGVPFFLRAGKRLRCRHTHIAMRFHSVETSTFRPYERSCGLQPNLLFITLQPDEGFDLRFQVKEPGAGYVLSTQRFRFRYGDVFGPLADAYETLLRDVVLGDRAHFVCDTEIEAAWNIYQPLLKETIVPHRYVAGSWGPPEAELL
ncbi:MAG: glucose-6-phosphate dehydrogenase (NADP(+)), partial [Dehalococcoidia bacterium]|nr:glucose-6-phosphate dehydrogenase (NADP(+)) [Dehalococcoidia bacterium]